MSSEQWAHRNTHTSEYGLTETIPYKHSKSKEERRKFDSCFIYSQKKEENSKHRKRRLEFKSTGCFRVSVNILIWRLPLSVLCFDKPTFVHNAHHDSPALSRSLCFSFSNIHALRFCISDSVCWTASPNSYSFCIAVKLYISTYSSQKRAIKTFWGVQCIHGMYIIQFVSFFVGGETRYAILNSYSLNVSHY